MDRFFIVVTALGNPLTILSILVLFYLVVSINHRRHVIAALAGAITSGSFLAWSIKNIVRASRPHDNPLLYASGFSFPSAHALLSTVAYGFIGYYLWHYVATKSSKAWAILIGVIVPLAVGVSRLYLGVHRSVDVVAGWGIGAAILVAWIGHLNLAQKRDVYEPHLSRLSHFFLYTVIVSEVVFISVSLYLFQSHI